MKRYFNRSLNNSSFSIKNRHRKNTADFINIIPSFLLQRLENPLSWNDLVLNPTTEKQIYELKLWLKHKNALAEKWGMHRALKPGYRALFHGPPGTGKTLTASLLGKHNAKDVYRIDLSLVVSKYIGETEKNLAKIFNMAEYKDWILFFDEADALFSKRKEVSDAHDRYANQEIAYLFQRIENYNGLAILASNNIKNIDKAFLRRFEAIVNFPLPTTEEKVRTIHQSIPEFYRLPKENELIKLCEKHKVSGEAILNAIRYCLLVCLEKDSRNIEVGILDGGMEKS